jgi:hypothetical protein
MVPARSLIQRSLSVCGVAPLLPHLELQADFLRPLETTPMQPGKAKAPPSTKRWVHSAALAVQFVCFV